jgi:5-methylcytosine-specific restriction endonuclease McrA
MAKWPYNTPRWVRMRKRHLLGQPLCVFCDAAGRTTVATVVDHIVPLQSLCQTCHSGAKQSEEHGGYPGYGLDGIPLKGWE